MRSSKKINMVNFVKFPENKPKHLDTGYLVQIKGLGAHFVQARYNGHDWFNNDMERITPKVGMISDVAIFEFTNW